MDLSLRPLASSPLRCAWCHDDLAGSSWRCPCCAAAAHADCALEGCPTLGCRVQARLRLAIVLASPRRRWLRARFRALCTGPTLGVLAGALLGRLLAEGPADPWVTAHALAGGVLGLLVTLLGLAVDRPISARADERSLRWTLGAGGAAAAAAALFVAAEPAFRTFTCLCDGWGPLPPPTLARVLERFAPAVLGAAGVASLAFALSGRAAWAAIAREHHELRAAELDVSAVRRVFAVGLTVGFGLALATVALAAPATPPPPFFFEVF